MYGRILVPTDGSTGTAHVALQALNLAEQYGAEVHALYVIEESERSLLTASGGDAGQLEKRAEHAVKVIERMAESHGTETITAIREGDPADTILEYAEEIKADIIVAGTHGRSGIKRHLIGSVAERLVRHADCPVMTIRLPETDVTVQDSDHARSLIEDALDVEGYDATIDVVERQLSVWVGIAEGENNRIVVYLDPETQRTSVHPQSR